MDDAEPLDPDVSFAPLPRLADVEPDFGEFFEAQAGNVLRDSITSSFVRGAELTQAEHGVGRYGRWTGPQPRPSRTPISAADAAELASAADVTVDFGTGQTTREAAEIMIDRARRRAVRDGVVAQYKPSVGTQLGVSLLASLADPLNVGAAFLPFVGEARYGAFLASAGGFGGRTAVRAGVGAVEGLAGAALVEPLIAEAATQEGRDYQLADAMNNLAFGTVFGGGLHVVGGTVAEKLFKRTITSAPVESPADIIDRLPLEMNQLGMRAAVADLAEGRPVAAAEAVDVFARDNAGRGINFAETLRRDGPAIDDTVERIGYWERRLAGQQPQSEKPGDFRQFLRDIGGIRDTGNALRGELGDDAGNLPRGILISEHGAKRTQRGIEAERVIQEAITQGFVADRAEFVAALRTGGKGFLRKVDRDTADARAAEAEHTRRMLVEAGVNPSTRNALKARAIVGREQQIIASERARQAAAVDRLQARSHGDEPAPKVEPLPPPGSSPLDDMAIPAEPAPRTSRKPDDAANLDAETTRRLGEIEKWLPAEQVAEVKAALEKSRADLDEMNRVLESATACVLGL